MRNLILLLTFFFISTSCSHLSKKNELPLEPSLSWNEAKSRASRIENVQYTIDLEIGSEKETFDGTTKIFFDLKDASQDLRIDLQHATLFEIKTNGQATPLNYNGHFITIPQNQLQSGRNEIQIKYERKYANDGKGLHRFTDPEDQRTYLHTQFETYYASRMFPSFDQPDIKATYTMNVIAPKDWEVITSVRENKKTPTENEKVLWSFPESQKFSTYLISLHAGPYKKWERKGKIPLRLFARQTLAQYVRPNDWFSATEAGFKFFNSYFGYTYPYLKYDQVIAPEFNSGAMENVAAVTFTERFISRGEYSEELLRNQANVILHEMAHMWFGNLVTMKWWDDLWLNESFATYMASVALSQNPRFKSTAWQDFLGTKGWGYWEDQMSTTHPILAEVHDTDQAKANFDGITYAKGAAVLKQLHYLLGNTDFQNGLKEYFQTYAEKNTRLDDFIQSLSKASGTDLSFWKKEWLETAGLNLVEAKWKCESGKLSSLQLIQSAPKEHPTLRSHRLNVGFVYNSGSQAVVRYNQDVLMTGAETSVQIQDIPCPKAVHPNFGDHAYIKIKLDRVSNEFFIQNVNRVKNDLLRQMVWYALWDQVRDGERDLFSFTDVLIEKGLLGERNEMIFEDLLGIIVSRRGGGDLLDYFEKPALKDLSETKTLMNRLQTVVFDILSKARAGTEFQKSLFDTYVRLARNEKNLARVAKILTNQIRFKGLKIDQDKRWSLIRQLAAHRFPEVDKLIEAELKSDPSYNGKLSSVSSQSMLLEYPDKLKTIERFKQSSGDQSLHELWAELGGLFPKAQEELRSRYSEKFYNDFKEVLKNKKETEKQVFYSLRPSLCSSQSLAQSSRFLKSNQEMMDTSLAKRIIKDQEEGQRCQKILSKALSTQNKRN